MPEYQDILVEKREQLAIVTLNRPQQLNALNISLMTELAEALETLDTDPDVRVVIITGSGPKAFAAGADIKEMADRTPVSMAQSNFINAWQRTGQSKKPKIAAVNGFALGGGFELALQCDIILASENARFGQPEISIGVIPGAGGTQRLARTLGKYKTMELVLLGEMISAQQLADLGLVSRVVPLEKLLEEAIALGKKLAERPPLAVQAAKQAINNAFETGLAQGLQSEQHLFFNLFASADQKEGMQAFIEKRKPNFTGQ